MEVTKDENSWCCKRERERESSNLKNAKGVTLIALVITIIVLLILAGVVLNTVLGNDGIIAKAQLAKEKTNQAQREEEENLNELENELANYSTRTNKLESTTIYPEGTEENPPTIKNSERIEVDNPYPGHKVYATVEIKYNNLWGETGWIFSANSGGRSHGIRAYRLSGENNYDKIIIQTGKISIMAYSYNGGSPFGNTEGVTSAPYRLNVTCLD